jgi:hypothetical protein
MDERIESFLADVLALAGEDEYAGSRRRRPASKPMRRWLIHLLRAVAKVFAFVTLVGDYTGLWRLTPAT